MSSSFLDAFTHLYKRVCPSIRPSVRWSVRRSVGPSVTRFFLMSRLWKKIVGKQSKRSKLVKKSSELSQISQNVHFRKHRCPNGLVYSNSSFLPDLTRHYQSTQFLYMSDAMSQIDGNTCKTNSNLFYNTNSSCCVVGAVIIVVIVVIHVLCAQAFSQLIGNLAVL